MIFLSIRNNLHKHPKYQSMEKSKRGIPSPKGPRTDQHIDRKHIGKVKTTVQKNKGHRERVKALERTSEGQVGKSHITKNQRSAKVDLTYKNTIDAPRSERKIEKRC